LQAVIAPTTGTSDRPTPWSCTAPSRIACPLCVCSPSQRQVASTAMWCRWVGSGVTPSYTSINYANWGSYSYYFYKIWILQTIYHVISYHIKWLQFFFGHNFYPTIKALLITDIKYFRIKWTQFGNRCSKKSACFSI